MTAKKASVTGVPDGVLRAVAARYEMGPVRAAERLTGGLASDVFPHDVFLLETDAGQIALLRARTERADDWSYQRRNVLAAERLT